MNQFASWLYANPTNTFILDTETTGLFADHQVIEMAVIDMTGAICFNSPFSTNHVISESAYATHGISDDSLIGKPSFDYGLLFLNDIIDNGAKILTYNAPFDMQMISQTVVSPDNLSFLDTPVEHQHFFSNWECVMAETSLYFGDRRSNGDLKSVSLGAALVRLGVDVADLERSHSALGDCCRTLRLISALAAVDSLII
jgi:DNA polymerase III subunit epsilon